MRKIEMLHEINEKLEEAIKTLESKIFISSNLNSELKHELKRN